MSQIVKRYDSMLPLQISVILPGNWNTKIFTPFWIKERLFEISTHEEIQVILDFTELDWAFQHQNIIIAPHNNFLEIKVQSPELFFSNEAYRESFVKILNKILISLPQTPIKALGLNIIYSFMKEDQSTFVSVLSKTPNFLREFETTMVRKSYQKPDYTINVISELLIDSVTVNFNFHYPKLIKFDDSFISNHINEAKHILKLENGQ